MGYSTVAYRILVGRPRGKRPLGAPRHRWANDIIMYLHEAAREGMDWMDVIQDRDRWRALVNAVMNLRLT